MIEFNNPIKPDYEYFKDLFINGGVLSGDGKYTKLCSSFFEKRFGIKKLLLMTSGSSALELAAILCDIEVGDEVIMPSFTFCSTANAFVIREARCKFVDIDPYTMNIDVTKIEEAISERTKAIVPVHYAGVSCDMDSIMEIASKYGLYVIEDAAQAVNSFYKGKTCGTIGNLGCYSFHDTKNYTMGEGGAICINNSDYIEKAEIYREKGTNRSKFFRGEIDKYSWISMGASYLPSDLNAAYLYPQLLRIDEIKTNRLSIWNYYYSQLKTLQEDGKIELARIPQYADHNAHIFWIKLKDLQERTCFIEYLKNKGIKAVFHYVPLHSSSAGMKYGEFVGEDIYTTKESERLVRLPIYYGMTDRDMEYVVKTILGFFEK